MRRNMTVVVAASALLAPLIVITQASFAGAASQNPSVSSRVIRLVEQADVANFITVNSGAPVGNRFVFSSSIFDTQGNRVGHDGGDCATTNPDGTAQCTISVVLPGGELTFQGLANGTDNTFAITGGTGTYRNAQGEARAVDTQPGRAELTIQLIGG
jgi:hypothetical protein